MLKRIYRLLLPAERRMGVRVVCAVFLSALLDFAGLAALLPILFFLLEKEGEGGDKSAALLLCGAAIVFILIKNTLVAGLSRFQNHYLMDLYRRLSFSLFTSYYHRGMLFIRSRGSVRLGYEVNFVCYAFSLNMLSPLLHIAGDLLLIFLVTAALLAYAPLTVLMLYAAFVPFMVIYGFFVRQRMRRCGEEEQQVRREQSRLAVETLKGYAELELNAAFPSLQRSFVKGLRAISECRLNMETVQHLPLCLSEMAVVVGLTLLTALGTGDVKALVGIFAVASFRLLPALRGILGGWTQIQNSAYCLQVLEEGLEGEEKEHAKKEREGGINDREEKKDGKDKEGKDEEGKENRIPDSGAKKCSNSVVEKLPFQKEIRISHLSFAYPDGKGVLEDFSCTIRKGEYVGISGESGIGKSTLFNLLLGFISPDEGRIAIDDILLTPAVRAAWHRRVGYVQQEVFILDGTLAENIALGCGRLDRDRIRKVLKQVCLEEWVAGLPQGMDTLLGEGGGRLSGGQKQRVGIARALYKEADVLLLDEATSALDNETESAINGMLCGLMREYGNLTILTIAHRESSLAYCHRVITLNTRNN